MDALMEAMGTHDSILSEPAPSVLFWEFGDSALVFRLFFWTNTDNPLDMWTVESNVRRSIYHQLHEHGVGIAYPQRDVHLDSRAPLTIQLETEDRPREDRGAERTRRGERKAGSVDSTTEEQQHVAGPENDSPESDAGGGEGADDKSEARE
jgi:small-conductance mechanosensitive channel